MKIVTSGFRYLDIDGYAGCIAYAELLTAQGHEAKAVCRSPWNESITATVRSWDAPLETTYTPSPDDTFILIDVSEPSHFESFVDVDRVSKVIDHHVGFEAYWQPRLGENAQLEFIGAACTQVYEEWQKAGLIDKMSPRSAGLLLTGILDNTLNFGAKVTTKRDKAAYDDLFKRSKLPKDWAARYFNECQEAILGDIAHALVNDTKMLTFTSLPETVAVGQLVAWGTSKVLQEHKTDIEQALVTMKPQWFLNLVNVGERKSYLFAKDAHIKTWLAKLLGIQFSGDVAQSDRLWLRKEIIKQDAEHTK